MAFRGAFPVSAALPLREEPFGAAQIGPWLRNLLPYGALKRDVADRLGAPPEDDLALIEALGGDAPGALSFGEAEGADPRYVAPRDALALLGALETDPLRLGVPGGRCCLSEEDARAPVAMLEGGAPGAPRLALARDGAISTHILHVESERERGMLENRAFHLGLAQALDLDAAPCLPGIAAPAAEAGATPTERGRARRFLLVARDDRERRPEGWIRLHREDLIQALGLEPEARYARQARDKATLEAMAALVQRVLPPQEFLKFLRTVLFHALIGNGHAHGKRYAFLLYPERRMAMMTDAVGPGPQPEGNWTFAQRVGGASRRSERLSLKHWDAFAEAAGLNGTFLIGQFRRMARAVLGGAAARVAEGLAREPVYESAILGLHRRGVERRAKMLLEGDGA